MLRQAVVWSQRGRRAGLLPGAIGMLKKDQTAGEIAAKIPASVAIFEKLGIDYCCGGDRSPADTCRRPTLAKPGARFIAASASLKPTCTGIFTWKTTFFFLERWNWRRRADPSGCDQALSGERRRKTTWKRLRQQAPTPICSTGICGEKYFRMAPVVG